MSDDLIDAAVRAARPALPTSLAPRVIARARRPHRARMSAAVLACVVFATVVIVLVANRSSHPREPMAPLATPAIAPAPPPPAPAPAPTPTPAVSPWTDVPALIAGFDREHGTEVAACATLEREVGDPEGRSVPRFRVSRRPVRVDYLVPHSIGYLGFSRRDRCYQQIASKLVVAELPEHLLDLTFTFGPLVSSTSAAYDAWRDPVAVGRDLVARSPKVKLCGVPSFAVSFQGGKTHVRLAGKSRCLADALGELVVPAVPNELSSIMIEVSP